MGNEVLCRMYRACAKLIWVAVLVLTPPVFGLGAHGLTLNTDKTAVDSAGLNISAAEILSRMEAGMAGIRDVQAGMSFRILIARLGFPFTVRADYYFKQPDKVKIALHGIPGMLLGDAPKTITAATTLTGFRKDFQTQYHAKVIGLRKINGRECYFLDLIPIDDGNVADTLLWVSKDNFTIPKLYTNYKDGSWIEVHRDYAVFDRHLLVSHIEAGMDFVKSDLKATVTADYSSYKLNQGLSDAIFE